MGEPSSLPARAVTSLSPSSAPTRRVHHDPNEALALTANSARHPRLASGALAGLPAGPPRPGAFRRNRPLHGRRRGPRRGRGSHGGGLGTLHRRPRQGLLVLLPVLPRAHGPGRGQRRGFQRRGPIRSGSPGRARRPLEHGRPRDARRHPRGPRVLPEQSRLRGLARQGQDSPGRGPLPHPGLRARPGPLERGPQGHRNSHPEGPRLHGNIRQGGDRPAGHQGTRRAGRGLRALTSTPCAQPTPPAAGTSSRYPSSPSPSPGWPSNSSTPTARACRASTPSP